MSIQGRTSQTGYASTPNRLVKATTGLEYAYRELGTSRVPLLLFQHFRGNLENWDPALVDKLATGQRVITFDNAWVGGVNRIVGSPVSRGESRS